MNNAKNVVCSGLGEPLMPSGFHTTHNMFFELLVAWGWQGVFFFYGYVFVVLLDCVRLHAALWRRGVWPPSRESLEALGVLVGIISMLAASMFLNRMRWELWWVFGAYVVCLKNIHWQNAGRADLAPEVNPTERSEIVVAV